MESQDSRFIDDKITVARNYKQCESNIKHIFVLLNKVGLIVNPEKYIFTQVQLIEYLYFIVSSLRILVSVTGNKKV